MLIRSSQFLGCCGDHIQPIGILHPRVRSRTCGGHDSTLEILEPRNKRQHLERMRGVSPQEERSKDHASTSTRGSSYRGGCPSVAGESLHPYAVVHQVNSERSGSDRRRSLAAQCLRAVPFPIWDSSRKGMSSTTSPLKIRREIQTLDEARC